MSLQSYERRKQKCCLSRSVAVNISQQAIEPALEIQCFMIIFPSNCIVKAEDVVLDYLSVGHQTPDGKSALLSHARAEP